MNIATCHQCGKTRELTHKITSEIINMTVCYECGIQAELVQHKAEHAEQALGAMTIKLFERPKVIPMFFECSVCHDRYTGEQQYAAHWYEKHG